MTLFDQVGYVLYGFCVFAGMLITLVGVTTICWYVVTAVYEGIKDAWRRWKA